MDFTKNGNIYETTFSASTPFNIHIERDGGRVLSVSRRTAGEGWETIEIIRQGRVIDADVYNDIAREFRIQSDVEPTMCEITFGSAVGPDVPTETWIDYTISNYSYFGIGNAKENSISSLVVFGWSKQNATPTPSSPKVIENNLGSLYYKFQSRNLLEIKDSNIVVGKYINNNGEVTTSLPNIYFQRFVSVKAGYNYTLSTSESINYANFMEYDKNGVFIKRTLYGSSATPVGKKVTHLMGSTTAYVIIGSNVNSSLYPEITNEDVKNIKWMFNEGSTALAYEDYKAGLSYSGDDPISINGERVAYAEPLCGIGTFIDKQEIVSGVVTRKVGVKVFDGSESSWYLSMSGDVYRYRYKFDEDDNAYYKSGRGTDMLSTHFKVLASGSTSGGAFLNGSSNAEYLFLIPDQSITTLEDFRKWLQMQFAKGNPVMVIYPLAEDKVENVAPQAISNPEGSVIVNRYGDVEMTIKIKKIIGEEIEFFINHKDNILSYKAKAGMTFYEFCQSEYNIDGFECYDEQGYIYTFTEGEGWFTSSFYLSDANGSNVIEPNRIYMESYDGGIGGGGGME